MIGRRGPVAQMEPQEAGRHVAGDSLLLMVDAAKVDLTKCSNSVSFCVCPWEEEEKMTKAKGKRGESERWR